MTARKVDLPRGIFDATDPEGTLVPYGLACLERGREMATREMIDETLDCLRDYPDHGAVWKVRSLLRAKTVRLDEAIKGADHE